MTTPGEPTVEREGVWNLVVPEGEDTRFGLVVRLDAGALVDVDAGGRVVGVGVLHPEAARLRARIAAVAAMEQPDPSLLNGSRDSDDAWAAGWWSCFRTAMLELADPAEVEATLARARAAQPPLDPARRRLAREHFRDTLRGMLEQLDADLEGGP